jgi:hypothetical protein
VGVPRVNWCLRGTGVDHFIISGCYHCCSGFRGILHNAHILHYGVFGVAKLGTVAVKEEDLFPQRQRPLYVEDYRIFINLVQMPIWAAAGLLFWLVVAANEEFLARPILFGGLLLLVVAPLLIFIVLLQRSLLSEFRRVELYE